MRLGRPRTHITRARSAAQLLSRQRARLRKAEEGKRREAQEVCVHACVCER